MTVRARVAILLLLAAQPAELGAQSPFPPQNGVLANGTTTAVSPSRVNGDFQDLLADPYGLQGLVLIVDDCNPDPEVYLDEALVHYEMADGPGRMYDTSLAWLVCSEPRFVGLFWAGNSPYSALMDAGPVQDLMAERLAAGNFTGAITAGIDEVARQLAADPPAPENFADGATDSDSASDASGLSGSTGEGDAAGAASGPADGEMDGPPWGRPGPALAAIALGAILLVALRRRQAGTPAGGAKTDESAGWGVLASHLTQLEKTIVPDSTAMARVVLAYEGIGDEAVLAVHRRHLGNVERVWALRARLVQATETMAALDAAERAAQLASMEAEARTLDAYAAEIAAEADHAEMLIEQAGVIAVEARAAIDEAAGSMALLGQAFPDPAALLAVARRAADGAEDALAAGQRLAAGRLAEEAREMARRLDAAGLGWLALEERVAASNALYARLDGYAKSSWADVRGNGHEAAESAETAVDMLARLADAATVPAPDNLTAPRNPLGKDEGAGFLASLEAVEAEIARGERLLDAVAARMGHIEAARESARPAVEAVRDELATAREWLARPEVAADVGSQGTTTLAAAEAALAEADAAMSADLPDWPAVVAAAARADKLADEALGQARAEKDRLEALRRQVQSARDAALAAVGRADGFNASHTSDLGATHLSKVHRAHDAVGRGDGARTTAETITGQGRALGLAEALAAFEEGSRLAHEAYMAMTADFERIEARRKEYSPRPDWMGPIVPVPIDNRTSPFPANLPGWFQSEKPRRQSSWGGRGGGGGGGGGSGGSGSTPKSSGSGGSRPSSSRRGGGRSW